MNVEDCRTLVSFDQWASRRLLDASSLLTPEEFACDLRASFGSVRGTLLHILDGEWHWLRFWQGHPWTPLAPEDYPDVAALQVGWTRLEQEQRAFAAHLTAESLAAKHAVRGRPYLLGELIQHLVNHSSYHRGQVAVLLRQLGHPPPPTDFRVFLGGDG